MQEKKITIRKNGPYKVTGDIQVKQNFIMPDKENQSDHWREGDTYKNPGESYYLCRCGHSYSKPYCDGTHSTIDFEGDEKADHAKYEEKAKIYTGESLDLLDERDLCAVARFCDRGDTAWRLIRKSYDPECEKMAIEEVESCPSGRLVLRRKDGTKIEPELPQEIGVIEDIAADCKGPLWVKGGIAIEDSKGEPYEIRNRVTLCRCGESNNMPFCDATHLDCPHMKKIDQ